MKKKKSEITVYDKKETSAYIDRSKPLRLKDIGIELPEEEPSKVISLRLPTELLNRVKAFASQNDVNYSSMIKIILSKAVKN
jgi:predicted DNA binding CopG/RHH family protein